MSEQRETDLERRLTTELRREMDSYADPFDANAVARRAIRQRSAPLRGPLLVGGTIVVAAVLTVVGVTVLPPAGSRTGGNLAVRMALTVHLRPGGELRAVASDSGTIFVLRRGSTTGTGAGEVLRIDPSGAYTGEPLDPAITTPLSLAYGFGSLWLFDGTEGVVRLDTETGAVLTVIPLGGPVSDGQITAGPDAIWASLQAADQVVRIDPTTNAIAARIHVPTGPLGILADQAGVWVTTIGSDTVSGAVARIDPATNTVTGSADIGQRPSGLARTRQGLWVAVGHPHEVIHLSDDLKVLDHVATTDVPVAVTVAGGRVWVGEQNGAVEVIDPADAKVVASGTAGSDVRGFALLGNDVWSLSSGMSAAYRLEVVPTSPPVSPGPTLPTYGGDICMHALLGDVKVYVDPWVSPPVWAGVSTDGGKLYLEWPSGFTMGLDHGKWAVFDRQGNVIVHDDATLTGAGGGLSPRGNDWWRVSVCSPGSEARIP